MTIELWEERNVDEHGENEEVVEVEAKVQRIGESQHPLAPGLHHRQGGKEKQQLTLLHNKHKEPIDSHTHTLTLCTSLKHLAYQHTNRVEYVEESVPGTIT